MRVTATKLRQNVYAILDEVLEKGIPVEVERKGQILKIVPEKRKSIFDRIPPWPDLIIGDPNDLKVDWLEHWHEPENLLAVEKEFLARKARNARKAKKRTKRRTSV